MEILGINVDGKISELRDCIQEMIAHKKRKDSPPSGGGA